MGKTTVSMADKKLPKKPHLEASQKQWDSYEKRLKEYNEHTKRKKTELERRRKIGTKK
jgi:hypothetical protein